MMISLTYLIITYNDPIPGSEEEFVINASKKDKPSITLYDVAIYLSGIDPRTGRAYEGGKDDQENPISPFVAQYSQMANYLQDYAHHYVTQLESYQLVGEFIEATGQKFLKQATSAEKTFQSIVSSADQNLAIFKLPIIRAVTAYSDFKLKQLVDPLHKPTALYIVNPPKDELTGKTDGVIKIILQNKEISDYEKWDTIMKIYNKKYRGTKDYPNKNFVFTFFNPYGAGLTYGLGQLSNKNFINK